VPTVVDEVDRVEAGVVDVGAVVQEAVDVAVVEEEVSKRAHSLENTEALDLELYRKLGEHTNDHENATNYSTKRRTRRIHQYLAKNWLSRYGVWWNGD